MPAICRCRFFICEVFFFGTARRTDSHISVRIPGIVRDIVTGVRTYRERNDELIRDRVYGDDDSIRGRICGEAVEDSSRAAMTGDVMTTFKSSIFSGGIRDRVDGRDSD